MKAIDGHKLLGMIEVAIESLPQVVTKEPPVIDIWSAWQHDELLGDICMICKYPNPDSFRGQYCSCCGKRMQNADAQQMLVREREARRKYNDLCNG